MKQVVEPNQDATRVLVFAPVGRDAALTQEVLQRASIPNVICRSMTELCEIVEGGDAGALLLTEESFDDPACSRLAALLNRQPSWSEIPVLLFAGGSGTDTTLRTIQSIESLRNVTLFERPIRLAAVLTAIRAALRARARQFEVRDLAMPEEDGFSFVRRVRQNSKLGERLPVIALSAFADARSEESARAAGFSAFLAKPAKPEALLGLIDRLLKAPDAP